VLRDDAQALATFEAGLKLAPSNVDLLTAVGQREQALGRWESALSRFERAAALDPRSANAARRHAYALLALRRYADAQVAQARAMALGPTNLVIIHQQAMLELARGDRAAAEHVARNPPAGVDPAELAVFFARYEEFAWLLDDAQRRLLLALPPSAFDNDRAGWGFVLAQLYALQGDAAKARAYADTAQLAYQDQLRAVPDEGQLHALCGVALAFLGRKAEAIRMGERGVSLVPISRDAYIGPYIQLQLARTYMIVGEPDKAIDRLEPLIRVPNNISVGWLRVDPTFDPLRKHPRFQALVQ
jgi:tetratricopeptide (TPR) repeat protein